jgi:hypothetical protein
MRSVAVQFLFKCLTGHKVIHIKEKWNERRETYVYIRFLLMNREMKEPFLCSYILFLLVKIDFYTISTFWRYGPACFVCIYFTCQNVLQS